MKKEQMFKPSAPAESGTVISLEKKRVERELQALIEENKKLDSRLAEMGFSEEDFQDEDEKPKKKQGKKGKK